MEPLKVFVSSTRLDLFDFREAVSAALARNPRVQLLAMEQFGAKAADAAEVSTEFVREADILVGVYASRYGHQPEPGGPSVTELEFDAADAAGKRRLCYIGRDDAAIPDPADAGGVETDEQRERLRQFKQRVSQLVRETFATPDELARKVAQDVADVLDGYPLGILRREVVQRWKEYAGREASLMQADEPVRPQTALASPLSASWRTFVDQAPWAVWILRKVRELLDEVGPLVAFETLRTEAAALHGYAPDLALAADITKLVDHRFFDTIDDLKRDLPVGRPGEDDPVRARLRRAARMARELRDAVGDPRFDRMLLVLGGHGAGKTFFLRTRLGAFGDPHEPFVLRLRRGQPAVSVADRLLEAIREATGFHWRSLVEFDRFLNDVERADTNDADEDESHNDDSEADKEGRPGPETPGDHPDSDAPNNTDDHPDRLVVLIDDFQKGYSRDRPLAEDLAELRDFMMSPQHPHGLYWCLTAHDSSYPALASPSFLTHWRWYGYVDTPAPGEGGGAPAHIGSWTSLDALNEHAQTGIAVARAIAQAEDDPNPPFENVEGPAAVLLSSPLIALIAGQLRKKLPDVDIVDLHYVGFVEAFWEDRQRAFEGSDFTPDQLGRVVAFVARVLARDRETPAYGRLLNALVKEAEDNPDQADLKTADEYGRALAALTRANLVAEREEWSDEDGLSIKRLQPRIEIFWAWRLAAQLTRKVALDAAGGVAGLLSWFEARAGTELGDGAFAFALWLLDDRKRSDELREMTTAALTRAALPGHAAWLAGSRGTAAYQRLLLEIAGSKPGGAEARAVLEAPGGRALFAFLHFVAHADAAAIGPEDERLLWTQPLYPAIASSDRSDYFEFVARRVLARVDNADTLVNCLDALVGCEAMQLEETLSSVAYERLRQISRGDEEQITDAILKHLRRLTEQDTERRVGGRNAYVWQWLIHLHARRVVELLNIDAFEMFERWGWLAPRRLNVQRGVAARLREEPKLALGWWYRADAGSNGQEDYVALVLKLLRDRNPLKRETGYFLMRHTVALDREDDGQRGSGRKGPRTARVDRDFRAALELAARDPSLANVRAGYPVEIWREE